MPDNPQIHYVRNTAIEVAQQNSFMRDVIARSMEILRTPVTDTFLGRKTQEPFPQEDEDTRIARWMASKVLQSPQ